MTYLDKDWRLSIFYDTLPTGVSLMSHVQHLWVNITSGVDAGGSFDNYQGETKDETLVSLTEFIEAYMIPYVTMYSDAADINRAELWAAPEGTDDFQFYSVKAITLPGTGVTDDIPTMQGTFTFRAQNGKGGRVQFMEPIVNTVLRIAAPTTIQPVEDIFAFLLDPAASIAFHRSRSFYIAGINYCGNISDALEKRRYR